MAAPVGRSARFFNAKVIAAVSSDSITNHDLEVYDGAFLRLNDNGIAGVRSASARTNVRAAKDRRESDNLTRSIRMERTSHGQEAPV